MTKQAPFSLDEVKEVSTLVADRLAEMIQSGELKPRQPLVQMDLAKQFGVSRIAIRDALHKLIHRGLAVKVPRRGIIVRPLSCKTIRDIIAVRRALEVLAVREACSRMSEEDLEHLEALIQEQEVLTERQAFTELIQKDWEFHQFLLGRCENEVLREIITDLWNRMRQAQGLVAIDVEWGEKWVRSSARFHRRLLNALRVRDADQVGILLNESFDSVEQELIHALKTVSWVDQGE